MSIDSPIRFLVEDTVARGEEHVFLSTESEECKMLRFYFNLVLLEPKICKSIQE